MVWRVLILKPAKRHREVRAARSLLVRGGVILRALPDSSVLICFTRWHFSMRLRSTTSITRSDVNNLVSLTGLLLLRRTASGSFAFWAGFQRDSGK